MDGDFSRTQIEQEIVEAFDRVVRKIDPGDQGWLGSQEMEDFLDAWSPLITHYAFSDDTVIAVAVVREWIHLIRILYEFQEEERETRSGAPITSETKRRARELTGRLDYYIDEIIKEVERTINNQGEE